MGTIPKTYHAIGRPSWCRGMRILAGLCLALATVSCGYGTGVEETPGDTGNWNITISLTSTQGNLPVGRRVNFISTAANYMGYTEAWCYPTSPIGQDHTAVVTQDGLLEVQYIPAHNSMDMFFSLYLDMDGSQNLTPGDVVLGDSSFKVDLFCTHALLISGNNVYENLVAESALFSSIGVGSRIYSGAGQPY